MTPPEKNVIRRVGKLTLYGRGCHPPIFPHYWLKQSACGRACWPMPDERARRCFDDLVSDRIGSVAELASLEGISDRYEAVASVVI
jgi:hypothetical protein